jgi:hypothetical protein
MIPYPQQGFGSACSLNAILARWLSPLSSRTHTCLSL